MAVLLLLSLAVLSNKTKIFLFLYYSNFSKDHQPMLTLIRFTVGPLPFEVCFVRTIILYSNACSVLLFVDLILVSRYFFLFVLKNPAAVLDDFW